MNKVMDRPTILMVHGAFGGGWAFDRFIPYFQGRGYRCLAPDLRHHEPKSNGAPALELARTSLVDYVRDLETLIASLEGEIILMGHSMGGLLCQILASRGHGEKLVLLAPSAPAGIIPSTSFEMLTAFGIFAIGAGWGQMLYPDFKTTVDHALGHMPRAKQKEIFSRLRPESGSALFEIMCWMLDMQQASRVDPRKVTCPVLAVAGSQDAINAPDTVRQVAQRYGSRADYHCFEGVSHWLLDGPDWEDIAQHCADWLERPLQKEQANVAAGATIGG